MVEFDQFNLIPWLEIKYCFKHSPSNRKIESKRPRLLVMLRFWTWISITRAVTWHKLCRRRAQNIGILPDQQTVIVYRVLGELEEKGGVIGYWFYKFHKN